VRTLIAVLPRAQRDIVIGARWCPAHKGVTGNEKADEWVKSIAEEPDARGVEWLSYSDRAEACVMPLPRSLAILKWDISVQKWAEARQGAVGRTSKLTRNTKRLASRFYQVKTGHCLTGKNIHWTKNRPTHRFWWCQLSDIWVEGQPRLDEATVLSCVRKSSGGGGGNSPLVTRQAATGDI